MADDEGRAGQAGQVGPEGQAGLDGRASAELKAILEALIFASPDPLTPKAIFKLLDSEPKEDIEAALAALNRQALHAARLTFQHPVTGEIRTFESPPPPDMAALISALKA